MVSMKRARLTRLPILLVFIVLLFFVPTFLHDYTLHIAIMILIYIILTASFRLITLIGEWSLAHTITMGAASYTCALLTLRLGWPFLAAFSMGILVAAFLGLLYGYPALRTKGIYFLLVTWAMGEAMRLIWSRFDKLFGGPKGIPNIPPPVIDLPILPRLEFTELPPHYYLALVLTIISLFIMYRLEKSRVGMIWNSISDCDALAPFVGINIGGFKLLNIVIASMFAGVAGGLYVYYIGYINPNTFSLVLGLNVCVYAIVGGVGSPAGPVIGTLIFVLIGEQLRPLEKFIPAFNGAILIAVLVLLPGGLMSLPDRVRSLIAKRQHGRDAGKG